MQHYLFFNKMVLTCAAGGELSLIGKKKAWVTTYTSCSIKKWAMARCRHTRWKSSEAVTALPGNSKQKSWMFLNWVSVILRKIIFPLFNFGFYFDKSFRVLKIFFVYQTSIEPKEPTTCLNRAEMLFLSPASYSTLRIIMQQTFDSFKKGNASVALIG